MLFFITNTSHSDVYPYRHTLSLHALRPISGTKLVVSAIKKARIVTGRTPIVSFTNAFHGMTLGSHALTVNATKRDGAGISLNDAIRMPYDGYLGDAVDTLDYFEGVLADNGSGEIGRAQV